MKNLLPLLLGLILGVAFVVGEVPETTRLYLLWLFLVHLALMRWMELGRPGSHREPNVTPAAPKPGRLVKRGRLPVLLPFAVGANEPTYPAPEESSRRKAERQRPVLKTGGRPRMSPVFPGVRPLFWRSRPPAVVTIETKIEDEVPHCTTASRARSQGMQSLRVAGLLPPAGGAGGD